MSISHNLAETLISCFEAGGKLIAIGNGGSASQASHLVAELVGHFEKPRRALPAIALTTDISVISAVANDDGYKYIFSRQIEALGKPGDVLLILSTSGNSKNCIQAEFKARQMGITIRMLPIKGDFDTTASIQERHLKIIHETCREIDKYYAKDTH